MDFFWPQDQSWTFVSIPDFLNVHCDFPQKGWEDALSYILESVKREDPDYVVVAGHLVMGHWDDPGGAIEIPSQNMLNFKDIVVRELPRIKIGKQ